ncbi:unnamed protein product [Didymodactylos carnosus]|uniref:SH2 domain-containing protein n=1 Tax=Didymodactylos carnosus TaxID=1234261 RepID=A0A814XH27_9BILA|nr:unnamed protein product [Didymodactylos carnosus]CAF3980087.1 unnamed protein product [Didymodactylos carnosus]
MSEKIVLDKTGPTYKCWYHGRLNRCEAEERLTNTLRGSYLVRESEQNPGTYSLSYKGNDEQISHFKISTMCGEYHFGGRQFDSLQTLIGYYSYLVDIIHGERLLYPVKPANDIELNPICVALKAQKKTTEDADNLHVEVGDHLSIEHCISDDYYWCRSLKTQTCGVVNKQILFQKPNNCGDSKNNGYQSNINKDESMLRLSKGPDGSYLILPSSTYFGDSTLFVHINKQMHRFRIKHLQITNKYSFGGRLFDRYVFLH